MSGQEEHPTPNGDRPGEVTVRRFIDRENDVLVTKADFGPLFAAYLDHVRRWEVEPDGLSQVMMRQGLGAVVLHLVNRPATESVGWTIHVQQPPTNLFLAGDAAESNVTGRVYTEGVKDTDDSRMYVQVSREGRPPTQSMIDIEGVDVLSMFEQYYEKSEQVPARFFEVTDSEYLMVLALPDADDDWVAGLSRDAALALLSRDLKPLGEETYRFQCGCTSERMLEVVRGLFADRPDELFREDDGVEIFCPRCGRRWWVDRESFEAMGEDAAGEGSGEGKDDGGAGEAGAGADEPA